MHPAATLISDSQSCVRAAIARARPYSAGWPEPAGPIPMLFRIFDDGQIARIISGHTATVTLFTVASRPQPAATHHVIHLFLDDRSAVRLRGDGTPGRCRYTDCAEPDRCSHPKWASRPLCLSRTDDWSETWSDAWSDTLLADRASGTPRLEAADGPRTVQDALDRVCLACCTALHDLVNAPACPHLLPRRLCLECATADGTIGRPIGSVDADRRHRVPSNVASTAG